MRNHRACKFALLLGLSIFSVTMNRVAIGQEPAGVWRGEWHSASTGHHGPMRAVIRPQGNGQYQATFTGRFALVVPFAYRVTMTESIDAMGNSQLNASKKLGPLMGSYNMQTTVLGSGLSGGFQANKDTGTIRMQRVR